MSPRTAALAATLAAIGIALAGCGGSDPVAAPQSPTLPTGALNGRPSGGTSGSPGNLITNPPNGSNTIASELPAGFPLPPGATTGRVAARQTDITAPINVPDGDEATSFWKQTLPAAGYAIGTITVSDGIGAIPFTGKGCVTGSQLGVSGEHVQFRCQRG
jgi:hypothetical protein